MQLQLPWFGMIGLLFLWLGAGGTTPAPAGEPAVSPAKAAADAYHQRLITHHRGRLGINTPTQSYLYVGPEAIRDPRQPRLQGSVNIAPLTLEPDSRIRSLNVLIDDPRHPLAVEPEPGKALDLKIADVTLHPPNRSFPPNRQRREEERWLQYSPRPVQEISLGTIESKSRSLREINLMVDIPSVDIKGR